MPLLPLLFFFFFNDTATTEIYTLSLHDALPISPSPRAVRSSSAPTTACSRRSCPEQAGERSSWPRPNTDCPPDRKSTRLNSSHGYISYAVFCLKKKKKIQIRVSDTDITVQSL